MLDESPVKPALARMFSGSGAVILLASALLLVHCLTNARYGFHRDELATLDDAGHLAWGYVGYPPVTPLLGRLALELFGPSLVGVRFFSALAMSCAMVLAGLTTRELGGSRTAQLVTAFAVAIAPLSLIQGALFQYVSFDYLWWVLTAYLALRLLKSEDPRWIGAAIAIHARDVRIGRTAGFLSEQLRVPANPVTIAFWTAGGDRLAGSDRGGCSHLCRAARGAETRHPGASGQLWRGRCDRFVWPGV
jgi:hypothetical protein